MILLCNQQSFICTHIDYCHPHCYLHHSRSCARLVRAIKLLYGDTVDSLRENSTLNNVARGKKQKEVSMGVEEAECFGIGTDTSLPLESA